MKKKLLSTALIAAMAAALLAGCGGKTDPAGSDNTETVSQTEDNGSGNTEGGNQQTGTENSGNQGGVKDDSGLIRADLSDLVVNTITPSYQAALPTGVETSPIFVEKVEGIPDDFIKGMDISSLLVQEASGVRYYDENGNETDLMKLIADAGINYVRVRVWNDPFDADGNGYGGGNCTAETAAEIGRRAAEYGMKINVDFHYSDFWADPSKQMCPKAWEGKSLDEKCQLLYDYTVESLKTILAAGADVGMVQIGNETNTGLAGDKTLVNKVALLKAGSLAVRDVSAAAGKDIKVAVHYTNIDNPDNILVIAKKLRANNVDYDIFGISYYCYWHGSMENLTNVLTSLKEQYGVETCVMETAYMFTGEDGDGSGNSVSGADALEAYPASVQGQANAVRDVIAHTVEGGGLGVFYWEGAWTPVGKEYSKNAAIWETYGSGWASKYAAEYDPKDAGQYYGGCSWDNQAFFDFDSKKLASLDVWKYVNHGAVGEKLEVLKLKSVDMLVGIHEDFELPDAVDAAYNDTTCTDKIPVIWNAEQLAAVDADKAATYTVTGTTEYGNVTATIKVASVNYVQNPGFEDADVSMWQVEEASSGTTDVQHKASDAYSGEYSYHFWNGTNVEFKVWQTLENIPKGVYDATVCMQGGDVGSDAEFIFFVDTGSKVYESDPVALTGWVEWKNVKLTDIEVDGNSEVKIGISAKCAPGGWGTFDDFEFYSQN